MTILVETLAQVASPANLIATVVGTVGGLVLGAMPGIGTILALSLALPFTFSMDPGAGITLLMAIYASSIYGGSISAVLLNTPGTPQSAVTCLDGYPMAQRGDAAEALGWVTSASALGGLLSVAVLVAAAPPLARLSKAFGPIELFSLLVFALVCVAWVSRESLLKGILAVSIGLFLATIGPDPMTGDIRYSFGLFQLSAGIQLIPVLVGLFALSELMIISSRAILGTQTSAAIESSRSIVLPGWPQWKPQLGNLLRSSAIGSFFGTLPGPGAVLSAFVAYSEARRTSPNRDNFGKGEPAGLVASESANNAVTGGALVPTLSLGIPGDAATAIMLTALMIHGITPGPRLFELNGVLVYTIFASLFVINIVMFVAGTALSPMFIKILRVPQALLVPSVVILAVTGTYLLRNSVFDLAVMMAAGLAGLVFRAAGIPLAPIVIGLVLGAKMELTFRQGLILMDGSFLSFLKHPIAAVFFAISLGLLVAGLLRTLRTTWREHRAGRTSGASEDA